MEPSSSFAAQQVYAIQQHQLLAAAAAAAQQAAMLQGGQTVCSITNLCQNRNENRALLFHRQVPSKRKE